MGRRQASPVRVFDKIAERPDKKSPYIVRWVVNGEEHAQSFKLKSQARAYHARLITAIADHERFSTETGVPVSWELSNLTAAVLCHQWVSSKKSQWEVKTRESNVAPLAEMLVELVPARSPKPSSGIFQEIAKWLMSDDASCPPWLAKNSLPLDRCTPAACQDAMNRLSHYLDGVDRSTTLKKATTVTRYRRACRAFFDYVVKRELLVSNPWPTAPRGKRTRKERITKSIRIDLLPSLEEASAAVERVRSHQPGSKNYQLICAMVLYAGFRPSEARALCIEKCKLPREGWGEATIDEAVKQVSKLYSLADDDEIGAPKTDERIVPLPPVLVAMIREHTGVRTSGLICPGSNGKPVDLSRLDRAWRRARGDAPWRIYDLRHAHATIALRAGVPAVEVARRLGHSVEVLHSTYEGAMPGDTSTGNALLEAAFT
jgi:integrase